MFVRLQTTLRQVSPIQCTLNYPNSTLKRVKKGQALFKFIHYSTEICKNFINVADPMNRKIFALSFIKRCNRGCFCIVFFYRIVRGTSMVIVNGIGAFKGTKWQSLFEGLLNLILSIILVQKYSINGVLISTIIAYLLTGFWFVPNYIFQKVFHTDKD